MKKHRKPYIVYIKFNNEQGIIKELYSLFQIIKPKKKNCGLKKILSLPKYLNNPN